MSWFVLTLIYVVLASFSNILRKIMLDDKRSDVVGSAIIFQLLGAIIVAIFAFWHGFILPPVRHYPFNFLIQASFWGLSTLTLFKAYQYIEASEVTILFTLESVVTIIAAQFFLHERFTTSNIIGTILLLLAIIFISQTSSKMKFSKGVLFSIISSSFAGLAVVNDTFMLKHADTLSYLTVGFLTPGFFLLAAHPKVITKLMPLLKPDVFKKNVIFTTFLAIAAIAFYLAIAYGGEVSQVNTIAQASVVLTVILAAIILKERDHLWKKAICAILVTIGVLLLR